MAERITAERIARAEARLARAMGTEQYKGAYTYIGGQYGHSTVESSNGYMYYSGLTQAEAVRVIECLAAGIEFARAEAADHFRI